MKLIPDNWGVWKSRSHSNKHKVIKIKPERFQELLECFNGENPIKYNLPGDLRVNEDFIQSYLIKLREVNEEVGKKSDEIRTFTQNNFNSGEHFDLYTNLNRFNAQRSDKNGAKVDLRFHKWINDGYKGLHNISLRHTRQIDSYLSRKVTNTIAKSNISDCEKWLWALRRELLENKYTQESISFIHLINSIPLEKKHNGVKELVRDNLLSINDNLLSIDKLLRENLEEDPIKLKEVELSLEEYGPKNTVEQFLDVE